MPPRPPSIHPLLKSRIPKISENTSSTIIAFMYKPKTNKDTGGIVIGVNPGNSASEGIAQIGPRFMVAGCLVNFPSFLQMARKFVKKFCKIQKRAITVDDIFHFIAGLKSDVAYRSWFKAASLVAGCDRTGFVIMPYDDGMRRIEPTCAAGSAREYGEQLLEMWYNPIMTDEEALKLNRRIMYHISHRGPHTCRYAYYATITQTEASGVSMLGGESLAHEFQTELNASVPVLSLAPMNLPKRTIQKKTYNRILLSEFDQLAASMPSSSQVTNEVLKLDASTDCVFLLESRTKSITFKK